MIETQRERGEINGRAASLPPSLSTHLCPSLPPLPLALSASPSQQVQSDFSTITEGVKDESAVESTAVTADDSFDISQRGRGGGRGGWGGRGGGRGGWGGRGQSTQGASIALASWLTLRVLLRVSPFV